MTYVSLGPSCIVKHHILKRFEDSRGYPFDHRATTPDVLITILETIIDGELEKKIISHTNYKMINRIGVNNYLEHKILSNFKLVHEYDPEKTESKMRHQFNNFIKLNNPTFIWSNAQGNLHLQDAELGMPIEDFYLTEARYNKMSSLINQIFGDKATIKFAVRPEYTDQHLLDKSNVYIINVPKSNAWSEADYGTIEQFDCLFI